MFVIFPASRADSRNAKTSKFTQFFPGLRVKRVEKIVVDAIGQEPSPLKIEDPVHVLPGFDMPGSNFEGVQSLTGVAIGRL